MSLLSEQKHAVAVDIPVERHKFLNCARCVRCVTDTCRGPPCNSCPGTKCIGKFQPDHIERTLQSWVINNINVPRCDQYNNLPSQTCGHDVHDLIQCYDDEMFSRFCDYVLTYIITKSAEVSSCCSYVQTYNLVNYRFLEAVGRKFDDQLVTRGVDEYTPYIPFVELASRFTCVLKNHVHIRRTKDGPRIRSVNHDPTTHNTTVGPDVYFKKNGQVEGSNNPSQTIEILDKYSLLDNCLAGGGPMSRSFDREEGQIVLSQAP